jgi:HAD superfamily hydrolase (TIGR01549 family)
VVQVIRGVIFDLGSTLISFDAVWGDVMHQAQEVLAEQLHRSGLNLDLAIFAARFRQEMDAYYHEREAEFVETTTAHVLHKVLADMGYLAISAEIVRNALQQMYAVSEAHWQPMPGVYEVLDGLRRSGRKLGMISNAGDDANVQRLIDRAHLRPYFDPILISAAVGLRKPNPALFATVLTAWHLQPAEAVMIGDTLGADILGAQSAGLHQIWLTTEADTPANRAHAGTIIPEVSASSLAELPALIDRMGATSLRSGPNA